MKEQQGYNLNLVDRINFIVISIVILISVTSAFSFAGVQGGLSALYQGIPIWIIALLIYKINFNKSVKAICFGSLVLAATLAMTYFSEKLDISTYTIFFVTIIIVALYFKVT